MQKLYSSKPVGPSIDFAGLLRQNTAMRRMIACIAMALLAMATFSASLFHIHADEHGESLIHAHFPEFDVSDIERGVHMESLHSHGEARSIDLLTTTAVHPVQFDAIILSSQDSLSPMPAIRGFVSITVPRAHAPPDFDSLIPRAPPA